MAVCAASIDPRDQMARAVLGQDAGMRFCLNVFGTPLPVNDDAAYPYRRSSGSTADRMHKRWFQVIDSADLAQAARQTPATESQQVRL